MRSIHTPDHDGTQGFTVIELIVVITIITILVTMTVFQNRRGRVHTEVINTAHELSLQIRELQTYALGVRSQGSLFEGNYGIHFSDQSGGHMSATRYLTFVDSNENFIYDAGTDTVIEQRELPSGVEFVRIDGITASGSSSIDPGPPPNRGVTIVFQRPRPDAIITQVRPGPDETWQQATIVLQSTLVASATVSITVSDAGTIGVE